MRHRAEPPVNPSQLEQAIGPDVLETLSRQTGLSQQELLARLSRELPDAVDHYTPQGRYPARRNSRARCPAPRGGGGSGPSAAVRPAAMRTAIVPGVSFGETCRGARGT